MRNIFGKLLALIIVLSIGAGVYSYFYLYVPKVDAMSNSQIQLDVLLTEQKILEAQMKNMEEIVMKATTELQHRLPVARQQENILADFATLQYETNVLIHSITMNSGMNEGTINANSIGNELPVPTGMKEISISLSVTANNFYDMKQFMEEIEMQKRMMKIKRIVFSGQPEMIQDQEQSNDVSFELLISTYYLPTLSNLYEELPKIFVPDSSEKDNPFANFERKAM